MANIDKESTVSLELAKEETGVAGLLMANVATNAAEDASDATCRETEGQESQTLLLGGDLGPSSSATNFTLGSSGSSGVNIPHPRRFSAVNINKKFLEKNSSATGATHTSSSSAVAKSGGPVCELSKLLSHG